MEADDLNLLPGVPAVYVRHRLAKAGGKELRGNFFSIDSSAALAVNAFAWFHAHPGRLPLIPGLETTGWPPVRIDVERCLRFPWRGGKHPWLDACLETLSTLIGIESKRHEPFRDEKKVEFSGAYDRRVWGDYMGPFEAMRDSLRTRPDTFQHLDAAQLVKHAFGLITQSKKIEKRPILVYLYAEPSRWPETAIALHRLEIDQFARSVSGAAVAFISARWSDWLKTWKSAGTDVAEHACRISERFDV